MTTTYGSGHECANGHDFFDRPRRRRRSGHALEHGRRRARRARDRRSAARAARGPSVRGRRRRAVGRGWRSWRRARRGCAGARIDDRAAARRRVAPHRSHGRLAHGRRHADRRHTISTPRSCWSALCRRSLRRMRGCCAAPSRSRRARTWVSPRTICTCCNGAEPHEELVRGLDTYLATVSDHGLNASTFTARVIVSTGSDFVSAATGAIGALKGPLHGGAPGPALDMVFEIGDAARAEQVLRQKIERGERLMGFGHRVYKVRDPRADVLAAAAARMFARAGDAKLYDLARAVEATALRAAGRVQAGPAPEDERRVLHGAAAARPRGSTRRSSRRRSRSAASPAGPRTASSSAPSAG